MRDTRPGASGLCALFAIAFVVGLLGSGRAGADAVVKLSDGRTLEGTSVRREGDLYLLELPGGEVISLPVGIVVEVGLKSAPRPPPPPQPAPGLRVAEPEVLAGGPVTPPTTGDQLAVFGKPAQFQGDPVQSNYRPSTWEMDPAENNWAPSEWAKDVVDTKWEPTSAFDDEDVLEPSRSEWAKSPVNSTWQPTDGFKKSGS